MKTTETTNQAAHEIVITRDGAPAMLDHATGEVMHPLVGPLVEAQRLYIEPSRLAARLDDNAESEKPLVLFDVGLGAGSNAIAAWNLSERMPTSARRLLEIVSFERDLRAFELASSSARAASFGFDEPAGNAAKVLLRERQFKTARTSWRVVIGELPNTLSVQTNAIHTNAGNDFADIVFWDPFSPRSNPSLWTLHAFAALRNVVARHATVHTYSAATATRSALLLAGFAVGVGPLSEGKETTIAAVNVEDLAQPLNRRWRDRLARSSSPFPSDAPPDALARINQLPQFALG